MGYDQRGRVCNDQVKTVDDFHHCQSGNEGRYGKERDEGTGHCAEACAYAHNHERSEYNIHRLSALDETSGIISLLQKNTCKAAAQTDNTTC